MIGRKRKSGSVPRKKNIEKPQPLAVAPAAVEEQIRKRAYELYLARNGGGGSELEDWLRAEQELAASQKSPRRGASRPQQQAAE